MTSTSIPVNDPQNPRWLVDLEKWESIPYTEVPQEALSYPGYGVVSYTWGYIVDKGHPAPNPPKGLLWDVPGIKGWKLPEIRDIMRKIGCRYIWWDWMCIPQQGKGMRPLSPELLEVQGQEIGKQKFIYKRERKSMVWLHSTSWAGDSVLKELLTLPTLDTMCTPAEMQKYIDQVADKFDVARSQERWLGSDWTLQEGVLLDETDLIDGQGNALLGPDFWTSDRATVSDLTVPTRRLALYLAMGYFIKSEGHEPPLGDSSPKEAYTCSELPETWLSQSLQTLLRSGFVGFWRESPLEILAGKQKRKYSRVADSCWALLGALGISDIEVTYDAPMDEIKRRLLVALLDKYQWIILCLPFPEMNFKEENDESVARGFKWTDLVDGVLLPVYAFAVEQFDPPEGLPTLSYTYDHQIKIAAKKGTNVYRPSKEGTAWFRHYRQDDDGLKIVSSRKVAFAKDGLLSHAQLLPLHLINMKDGVLGRRCLVLLDLQQGSNESSKANSMSSVFGGIIDLQSLGSDTVQVDEIILKP
ncbi:uncharacterized protein N7484_004901 [Penicillium longicatenatum]|uniref:uncharacterized protein n=1 Tax=Penicillium longicatenatum TaxID=1561947 RepID=UPI00254930E8|nr:uncharacterized protein N7484_004901 [Penicillium longicatenatum]KAJ5651178.1 hypothetical protein N7484_004901 [Penicillium longicatenatum]